ncbi:MAG: DNA cytosine methyltransferase [Candidatus Shapirobacteria bacterium]
MKVLVACERSGTVRDAFIARGHDAWSCDIQPSKGNHIQGDARKVLNDGWDMMIAHPPCTHLACSGAAWFAEKRADGRQQEGIELFMAFTLAPINKICIENPVGIMSRLYRKPDQIIQPYYFGDEFQKTTCIWLKNLPLLQHAHEDDWFAAKTHVGRGEMVKFASGRTMPKWYADARGDGEKRSVTFPGIAQAMAAQWE